LVLAQPSASTGVGDGVSTKGDGVSIVMISSNPSTMIRRSLVVEEEEERKDDRSEKKSFKREKRVVYSHMLSCGIYTFFGVTQSGITCSYWLLM
jgi:hypothetical protein